MRMNGITVNKDIMMKNKRNIVEWAMHYRQIVILVTSILVAFGMYALYKMNKNEIGRAHV